MGSAVEHLQSSPNDWHVANVECALKQLSQPGPHVGAALGCTVGLALGDHVCPAVVGVRVGAAVGELGLAVVGFVVGCQVCPVSVGTRVGAAVLGLTLGAQVCPVFVGDRDGLEVGAVGTALAVVGTLDGTTGLLVGAIVGAVVGLLARTHLQSSPND